MTDMDVKLSLRPSEDAHSVASRGGWSNHLDFILSCVGYAVGLGNVWRFPYLCYQNGGGAFLIPYVCMLALAGLPLFLLELSFGQYSSQGPVTVWAASPIFRGIGLAMVTISVLVSIYYNVIVAWAFYYMFASWQSVLPWSNCDNPWNTDMCKDRFDALHNCTSAILPDVNHTCVNGTYFHNTHPAAAGLVGAKPMLASEEYFKNRVLQQSTGLSDPGSVQWELCLCLLLSWIVVFFCLIKGVKTFGKVVYFTAIFPYFILTALLIRGLTLPGCLDGIYYFIVPRWEKLLEAVVWKDAAVQIFYSLSSSWGGLIAFASYNPYHNNVYRDTIIVVLVNCCTSIFAGFVIFSILGFMAHELQEDVSVVVDKGPGLAFVAYPYAITKMPLGQLWSTLFFFMLLMLGLDTQFAVVETVTTGITDMFPRVLRPRKLLFTLLVCVASFLVGLSMVTQGGMFVFQLMDTYSAGYSLMVVAFLECTVISFVYGLNRFCEDICSMINWYPNLYWKICWGGLTPAILAFIFVFSLIQQSSTTYGTYVYPLYGEFIAWSMVALSFIFVPGYVVYIVFVKGDKSLSVLSRFKEYSKPSDEWRPKRDEHLAEEQDRRPLLFPPAIALREFKC